MLCRILAQQLHPGQWKEYGRDYLNVCGFLVAITKLHFRFNKPLS